MGEPTRLNLGAGSTPLPGYINLDIANGQPAWPLAYADETCDEVRASHLLEHFSHRDTMAVLTDWVRVLKPGGLLKVAVPDFHAVVERYLAGRDAFNEHFLMGSQSDEHDYHRALFDEQALRRAFEELGLEDVQRWCSEQIDCSAYAISLNLCGRKPGGQAAVQMPAEPDAAATGTPFDWLNDHRSNVYSQDGEDGILAAVLEKVGAENRWVVECGAADGLLFSNSRRLIEQEGWSGLLVEADPDKHSRLQGLYADRPDVHTVLALAGASAETSLDALLDAVGAPASPDVMVIDVDGQDYYLLAGLCSHSPRVLLVEFGQTDPPDPQFIPTRGGEGQAGFGAILALGFGKGYRPVAVIGTNLLFVRQDLLARVASRPVQYADRRPLRGRCRLLLSSPRVGFTDHAFSIVEGILPHGLDVARSHGVFWGQCLTRMMEECQQAGIEYILTTDYDTLFTAEDVSELAAILDTRPEVDAVCALQKRREDPLCLFSVLGEDGEPLREISHEQMQAPLLRVHTAHFGLTMLRTAGLGRMQKPWFHATPGPDGSWGDGRVDEDVVFWQRWQDAGLSIYQANRVVVGHLELMVSWPGRDLRPVYQSVKAWQEEGKPALAWR